jgi:hypothetical protein
MKLCCEFMATVTCLGCLLQSHAHRSRGLALSQTAQPCIELPTATLPQLHFTPNTTAKQLVNRVRDHQQCTMRVGEDSQLGTMLPNETLEQIFAELPLKQLLTATQACRYWHKIIESYREETVIPADSVPAAKQADQVSLLATQI